MLREPQLSWDLGPVVEPVADRLSATMRRPKDQMRRRLAGEVFLFATLITVVAAPPRAAAGEKRYCPSASHSRPEKVPTDLVASVAKVFKIDATAVHETALVRCVGRKLMGCYVGANLNCDKADRRRALWGATAWCRENPGSMGIPMSATGHATIYEWSCKGRRAIAGKVVMTVDPQGYIASNWKQISPEDP